MKNKLTDKLKEQLIKKAIERRSQRVGKQYESHTESFRSAVNNNANINIPEKFYHFDKHPGYQQLLIVKEGAAKLGIPNPYFRAHEYASGREASIDGKKYLNFASYNYLGLSGNKDVNHAAKQAIDQYGTSVSASRVASGERLIHRQLEQALADAYEVEDCVVFVSGHATNVTTIGYLFGKNDLIIHDALIHNSALQGAQLSGATRISFPHNDLEALTRILEKERNHFEQVLIIVEGIYSMDGDYPDLPALVALKKKYKTYLMVDEAHSFGVMGKTGLGIREHFNVAGTDVDIWMGTLSKALASSGGYITGNSALVEHLKFAAPGFLYSVGLAPPVAAAALQSLRCMLAEPDRVERLQQRGKQFLEQLRALGVDVGNSTGFAIVPAITGSSIKAGRLADALFQRGINVQPILYPAVEEKAARLRFFISSEHTEEDINFAVKILAEEIGVKPKQANQSID